MDLNFQDDSKPVGWNGRGRKRGIPTFGLLLETRKTDFRVERLILPYRIRGS
jgi:hypothetical protein